MSHCSEDENFLSWSFPSWVQSLVVRLQRETLLDVLIILWVLLVELQFLSFQVSQNFRSDKTQLSNSLTTPATGLLSFSQAKIIYNGIKTRNIISIFYSQILFEIKFTEADLNMNIFYYLFFRSYSPTFIISIISFLELFWLWSFYLQNSFMI